MFDMFTKLSTLASPELMLMIEELPKKVEEWTVFLKKLDTALKYLDARVEGSDNKLSYLCTLTEDVSEKLTLLMSETAVTPVLHDNVLAMADEDPRNAQMNVFAQFGEGAPIQ
jgi:hypothetical protein